MVLIQNIIDFFYGHAAVVSQDGHLQEEILLLQKKYGRWVKVLGFSDYRTFFFAVHMAKAKHRPFNIAFLKNVDSAEELILKKSNPTLKTYKYSDTQELKTQLPVLR